jgi:hypothetical protein
MKDFAEEWILLKEHLRRFKMITFTLMAMGKLKGITT